MFQIFKKVLAQGGGSNPPGLNINPPPGLPQDLFTLLDNITTFLLTIVAPLAGIMILWAAFQMLTAAGDPGKFTTGKRTIIYAVVGLGLVILSKGITAIVKDLLGTP